LNAAAKKRKTKEGDSAGSDSKKSTQKQNTRKRHFGNQKKGQENLQKKEEALRIARPRGYKKKAGWGKDGAGPEGQSSKPAKKENFKRTETIGDVRCGGQRKKKKPKKKRTGRGQVEPKP